nr:hypothetical protein [Tanacetum cinerariifolium]
MQLIKKMMHEKFQMSSMGDLTFFIGLQVKQKQDGIFITQDKYVAKILKKYRFSEVKNASTLMETQKPLLKDKDGEEVDVYFHRSMIGSLKYLTSSRPNIIFVVCACARYQVNPKATVKAKTINGEVQLQALVDGKKVIITESTIRRGLQLEDTEGVDCLPNATIFEQLTLMRHEKILEKLTFYKAFFSPQWKFLIHTILQCISAKTTTWNKFSSTMAYAVICLATNHKFNFSKYIFESIMKNLDNVNKFLMYLRFVQVFLNKQLEGMSNHNRIYATPSHTKKIFRNMKRVGKGFSGWETPLFPTMMVQAQEEMGEEHVIDEAVNEEMDDSLERAAATAISLDAKVESSDEDEGLGEEDASKHRRISDIDADEGITLVSTHDDTKMFDADQDLHGEEVFVTKQNENVVEKEVDVAQVQVSTAVTTPTISIDKATLDQALTELKHANLRPRLKGYYQLAKRLQVEEQQELNNEEKATLFMQLLEKRRKFFEAKRAEEKRNKPPIQAQQKKCMMFDRAFKRVNTFVNFKTELVKESFKKAEVVVTEGSSKRAGEELEQENAKKQKIDDDKEKLS